MSFLDPATRQYHSEDAYTLHRLQVRRCDVCIFILRDQPRVFIGGGEFNFDGVAREADLDEIEALSERFGLVELAAIAVQRRATTVLGKVAGVGNRVDEKKDFWKYFRWPWH